MPVYSMNATSLNGLAVTIGRIGRYMSNAHLMLRDWNDRRVTRKVLSRLTDRELDDIGLTRSEIDALA